MNAFIQGHAALWCLAGNTLLNELGVPIPVLPTALFVGAQELHGLDDVVVFAGVMVGASLLGNLLWFAAGRRYGADGLRFLRRSSRILNAYGRRAPRMFEQWGSLALVLGRFVPGVLLVASPLAGATGMSVLKFVVLTAIGAALQSLALLSAGFLIRERIGAVLLALRSLGWPLACGAAATLAACVVWRVWRR